MGLTNIFSLAYNFWEISAKTMRIVSFEGKFVVDYKTCVIFDNPPSNQDIVVSQTTSKMHTYYHRQRNRNTVFNIFQYQNRKIFFSKKAIPVGNFVTNRMSPSLKLCDQYFSLKKHFSFQGSFQNSHKNGTYYANQKKVSPYYLFTESLNNDIKAG